MNDTELQALNTKWQARYRVCVQSPQPEITRYRWSGMSAVERREYQRPAIVAWLAGQEIQRMGPSGEWYDMDGPYPDCPLRAKPDVPKLKWKTSHDPLDNTTYHTTAGGYHINSRLSQDAIEWCVLGRFSGWNPVGFPSLEEAQTACQAHYEKEAPR